MHGFTFGTQQTYISHHLAKRDLELTLEAVGKEVKNWEGRMRIGDNFARFNRERP